MLSNNKGELAVEGKEDGEGETGRGREEGNLHILFIQNTHTGTCQIYLIENNSKNNKK